MKTIVTVKRTKSFDIEVDASAAGARNRVQAMIDSGDLFAWAIGRDDVAETGSDTEITDVQEQHLTKVFLTEVQYTATARFMVTADSIDEAQSKAEDFAKYNYNDWSDDDYVEVQDTYQIESLSAFHEEPVDRYIDEAGDINNADFEDVKNEYELTE